MDDVRVQEILCCVWLSFGLDSSFFVLVKKNLINGSKEGNPLFKFSQ